MQRRALATLIKGKFASIIGILLVLALFIESAAIPTQAYETKIVQIIPLNQIVSTNQTLTVNVSCTIQVT
ncbi:MAG: hypothetical protein NTW30_04165 [Candidatus Aenigmarchaeota archaeon]|nr:hypothetical protein [Candidatus Aenigmarchaeota archaeon]